ncbi:mismatch-specific thymine-DNA glycosylate [Colletotrichum orchidophilum]|uniref:Mismatch-specific thymine-DNA glycosylate n=1 Tax=Colletotrichum orchidophilum TaxID=1209926 RepID=A0A1G4AWL9_9PEZI|nr:mismatch-specific thymine-DNA glycosylate [Colletotrichum orchidophilum]OHE93506.1 mismatch-specific thymine-DNA glycosylate [Colletotrichum orchidophilum]
MESPFFDAESQPKPASFKGQLQMQNFMFTPTTAAPNNDPAAAASVIESAPSPRPLPRPPLRRSSRKQTPLGPVPSRNRITKNTTGTRGPESTSSKFNRSSSVFVSPKVELPEDSQDVLSIIPNNQPSPTPKAKPKRKRKAAAGYAPPSTYAHLPHLTDILAPDLLILFVGLNPGLRTAALGHVYAHPSNLFWKLLFSSGITPRLCHPTEDRELPRLFGLGNTNIVARPSRNGAELSKAEMDEGVGVLEDKVRGCRPEVVCLVGKSIWESVWRVRHGRGIKKEEFWYGWQDESENMGVVVKEEGAGASEAWAGAKLFVATSTSGLAATLRPAEKEKIWRELGVWCEQRRAEREAQVLEGTVRSTTAG